MTILFIAAQMQYPPLTCISFFFLRFYLFTHERHIQREAKTYAEGAAGFLQGDSVPGSQDHDLSQRQTLNH